MVVKISCLRRWSALKRVFLVCIAYTVFVVLILPLIGKDLPYSKFYDSTPEIDSKQNLIDNSVRLKEAKSLLLKYNISNPFLLKQSDALPDFCFVVVSVSRPDGMEFLTQVVTGLLPQISESNSVFVVYNAEGPSHSEAVRIASFVPVVTNHRASQTISKYAKEKEDYVYALEWCNTKGARYTVVIEDDALPHPDFMIRLRYLLKQHVPYYKQQWAFLKLYYPPKWQGWGNEKGLIWELVITSMLLSFMLVVITILIQALVSSGRSTCPTKCELFWRFVLSFSLAIYTLMTLGRPHWLIFLGKISLHFNFVVPAPGCCTPAVLYPQEHLTALISYLHSVECSPMLPVDLALDRFAEQRGLHKLLVEPDLVKHIGFVSSLGKGWKDPREFRL